MKILTATTGAHTLVIVSKLLLSAENKKAHLSNNRISLSNYYCLPKKYKAHVAKEYRLFISRQEKRTYLIR